MTPVSQTLQVIGLVLNFIGAILFAFPVIKSKKAIEDESSTYWGHNPPLRKAMQKETILGIIGLALLLIGFAMQIIAIYV